MQGRRRTAPWRARIGRTWIRQARGGAGVAQAEAPRRRLRAYKFALDPTEAQLREFEQHAGSARWAYNHANAILSRYSDTLRNRWNAWIAQHHGLSREQLYALPDQERTAIQAAARAAVKAENAQLAAELKIIDDHRKRVTHKGKPSVEPGRSEEHTSELQSRENLVCRYLL